MSSPPKRPRRSPRLLEKNVFRPPDEGNARPRKRPRLEQKQQQTPSQKENPMPARFRKTSLLSLPDEPLSLIMHHLGATNTGGSFRGPRHAFALAQTNTRLLCIFSSMLNRITPDVTNTAPPSLSLKHLLAVARIAGYALREIHLPERGSEILPELCAICPRLESLSLIDNPEGCDCQLSHALGLPLRSLTIENPSLESLRLLASPPSELKLSQFTCDQCYDELRAIMRQPPKTLHLEMRVSVSFEASIDELLEPVIRCISDACTQIEDLKISVPSGNDLHHHTGDEDFATEAARMIATVRRNTETSMCRSMKLRGTSAFRLLEKAHPKAAVELSRSTYTYGDNGDGFYALELPVQGNPPTVNLTRLREVVISPYHLCESHWKDVLQAVKLKRAHVHHVQSATNLNLNADLISMPFRRLHKFVHARKIHGLRHWTWLSCGVRELRLHGSCHAISKGRVVDFLRTIAFVLDAFGGEVLWIADLHRLHAKSEKKGVDRVRPAYRAALGALGRFESRGGDASTVRALLASMRWTGSPTSKPCPCLC